MNETERRRTLEDLHRRYAGAIFDKCRWMLGDARAAEDAVQETYLKAFQLLPRIAGREPSAHLPWLYCIATHVCLQPVNPNGQFFDFINRSVCIR